MMFRALIFAYVAAMLAALVVISNIERIEAALFAQAVETIHIATSRGFHP